MCTYTHDDQFTPCFLSLFVVSLVTCMVEQLLTTMMLTIVTERTQTLFLGSITRFDDPNMTYSTAFQYNGFPIEALNFPTQRDGIVWHQNVKIIVDMHDNPGRHMSEGMDHVSLCMELLECIECFIDEGGKELIPLVIREYAHELRDQFNLPAWTWPPVVVVDYDNDGAVHPSVPAHVDHLGRPVDE